MIDKLKEYLVQVGLQKYTPMFTQGVAVAMAALWAAQQGMLEHFGVTYGIWPIAWGTAPTGPVIVIELDTMSKATIAALSGLVVTWMRFNQHHTTGTPTQTDTTSKGETPQ